MARPTRVVYVENDPALRGIMCSLFRTRPDVEVTFACGSPRELLQETSVVEQADVALLDLALGRDEINGIDLGIALRGMNPDIGIVIHSQHDAAGFEGRVPVRERMGWTTFTKTGDLDIDGLVDVMRRAAQGISRIEAGAAASEDPASSLTPRQRQAMRLLSPGLRGHEIARQLDLSHAALRQDLSRAYRILVPHPGPSEDIRTKAILVYLDATKAESADEFE